ncbi:MAG: hypothetical protein KatS3mg110_0819 [Pirellulaceae bacterium]|nr:MAG: hypothetical protein KatS3mg110_0819 [Pirellulaceae bacterium]
MNDRSNSFAANALRRSLCGVRAYDMLADQKPAIETAEGLEAAAVAIALHAFEDMDTNEPLAELDRLACKVTQRLHHPTPTAILAHLHEVLFEEERFGPPLGGHLPLHVYLPTALALHRAVDVTLALIYKAIARRAGLSAVAVTNGDRFLILVLSEEPPQLVDVSQGGRVVARDELVRNGQPLPAHNLSRPYNGPSLRIVSHREWVARMLTCLEYHYWQGGHLLDMAAMGEMLTLVDSWEYSSG